MKVAVGKYKWVIYLSFMLFLILSGNETRTYAQEGIQICLQSAIPSLFPFILLSGQLIGNVPHSKTRNSRIISKTLCVPRGSELLLLLGYLGGYPIGAQIVNGSYSAGRLQKGAARRMLILCNNAGPSFLFGVVAQQFDRPIIAWVLWGVMIISSITTALIMPRDPAITEQVCTPVKTVRSSLYSAIKSMGLICGWIVIFRVILGFADNICLSRFPTTVRILISGFLELTNGCIGLAQITEELNRFLVASFLLSFGGICVTMQTATAVHDLGMTGYLPGKILQGCISCILCIVVQPLLFPGTQQLHHIFIGAVAVTLGFSVLLYFKYCKEWSRFSGKSIVYCTVRT